MEPRSEIYDYLERVMTDKELVMRLLQADLPKITDVEVMKDTQERIAADVYRLTGRMITWIKIDVDADGRIINVDLTSQHAQPGMVLAGSTMRKDGGLIH